MRLLLAHLLLGIVAAWLGTLGPWHDFYVVAFLGLLSAQVVLVGVWAGLASHSLSIRILGLLCGTSFVTGVAAIGGNVPRRAEDFVVLACLIFFPVAMISILFIVIRRYRHIALRRCGELQAASPLRIRFTVKRLLGITTVIALLLGCGNIIRSLGGDSLGIGVVVTCFVLCGCLMAWLFVWASLGQGNTRLRVLLVLGFGGVVGLLPPYFLGGPAFRFLIWPSLILVAGIFTMLSLLMVRSCGYRVVYADSNGGCLPQLVER